LRAHDKKRKTDAEGTVPVLDTVGLIGAFNGLHIVNTALA